MEPTLADQIIPFATAIGGALLVLIPTVVWAISQIRGAVKGEIKDLTAEVKKQGAAVAAQAVDMKELTLNTNSIKDALVAVTETGALAKGNLAGRAELKAEQNADAATIRDAAPQKVEVANTDPVAVKVTNTK